MIKFSMLVLELEEETEKLRQSDPDADPLQNPEIKRKMDEALSYLSRYQRLTKQTRKKL